MKLEMSMREAVMVMCDGNPGALSVLMRLMTEGQTIDPDSAFGGFGCLLDLDREGVYGPRIWMLYKDVCGEDIVKTCAMLRANQLGLLRASEMNHAIDNRGDGVDVDALLAKVKERLPRFAATKNEPTQAPAPPA